MSNYEIKKVDIRADVVALFYKRYSNGQGFQPTINSILEKVLSGRLVELSDHNLENIKRIALHFNCTNDDALNIALNSIEFELKETPKTRITLDKGEKVKAKKGKFTGQNPVTTY